MPFRSIRRELKHIFAHRRSFEIEPDEIFLDSSNLPEFDEHQFEGRIEKPVSRTALIVLGIFFLLIGCVGAWKAWDLQIAEGNQYAQLSSDNRLRHSVIFPKRGVIYDRSGVELAWNDQSPGDPFPSRRYAEIDGVSHVVGFVNYPKKDTSGVYFQDTFIGKDGVEKELDAIVGGTNGLKIIETNATGEVQSESVVESPIDGKEITLSLDAAVSEALYKRIAASSATYGFRGGAGVIIDVENGEVLALASTPEYSSEALAEGKDAELIARYVADSRTPFLNRVVSGLYAPGSIVKPFVAAGALDQGVIDPSAIIVSTGSIKVPNPYVPGAFSVFKDWKALGPVDMRKALAYSSDVYFYEVGGGFERQRGLGIINLAKYFDLFGLGKISGINLPAEAGGTIPTPDWKAATFPNDPTWRIGDTYNTAIGQYGVQVTPLSMARGIAAIANGGMLPMPTVLLGATTSVTTVPVSDEYLKIVREGMRMGVEEGTVTALAVPGLRVAGKTGTAEIGTLKQYVNSWVIGFFPYEKPRYAFAVVMERGPVSNLVGAAAVMGQFLNWLVVNKPEYIQ